MRDKVLIATNSGKLHPGLCGCVSRVASIVHQAVSQRKAMELLSRFQYKMVILVFNPQFACKEDMIERLRALSSVPIWIASGEPSREEEIQLLDAGADRYFALDSLLDEEYFRANVSALLRRMRIENSVEYQELWLPDCGLKVNRRFHKIYMHGRDLRLTPKQYALMLILTQRMGEVVEKEELYELAWKSRYDVNADEALKYHIREIRKKLEPFGAGGLIETAWGVGYRFCWENVSDNGEFCDIPDRIKPETDKNP